MKAKALSLIGLCFALCAWTVGCGTQAETTSEDSVEITFSSSSNSNGYEGKEVSGDAKDIKIVETGVLYDPEFGEAILTAIVQNTSQNVARQIELSPVAKDESGNLVGDGTTGGGYMNYVAPGETTAINVQLVNCAAKPSEITWNIKVSRWSEPNDTNCYQLESGASSTDASADDTRSKLEVTNTSEMDFSAVFLVAVYKNSSGEIIGSASGSEMDLPSGSSAVLSTDSIFPRSAIGAATVDYYTSWQL